MLHEPRPPDEGADSEDPCHCAAPRRRKRGRPCKNGVCAMRRRRPPGRAVESAGTGAGAMEGAAPEHGPVRLPERDGVFSPTEREWHGITWQDVPGHDKQTQKLNFSLLKRGMLHRHGCCDHLHGEPLKLRLKELSERNRDNSQVRTAQDGRRRRHTPRPQPP